jgi:hypothetical protein
MRYTCDCEVLNGSPSYLWDELARALAELKYEGTVHAAAKNCILYICQFCFLNFIYFCDI